MMPKCAFLSTDDLEDFVVYDELTYPAFADLGWSVEAVPWRAEVDWSTWDLVVIRSPWDYQKDAERFLEVLETIDRATRLENPLEVVRWNLSKNYLRDLEEKGVPIVPTRWLDVGAPIEPELFDALGSERIVVKPRVSGNADHTHVLDATSLAERRDELAEVFARRPFLAQPFVPSVVEEGEYSLFYFGGTYSHAILKTPKSGDFRVQEEHGGTIRAIEPDAALRRAAARVLEAVPLDLLYARVDLVRTEADDPFRLMELELIEPSLYFPYDAESPARFARAAVRCFSRSRARSDRERSR